MRYQRFFGPAVLALAAFLIGSPAQATTATGQFNVTATVLDNCAVTAGNLAFGNYSASSGSPATANSTVSVTCTNGLHYTVALDGGSTTSAVAARAMTDGASHNLGYGLYTTSGYGTLWGDGSGVTATIGGTGNGAAQPLTIYGRIPASQFVASGSYSDTVTVSVSY